MSLDQQASFLHYMRAVTLYAEGKYISEREDLSQMARKIADLEQDLASKVQNNVIHWELHDIWMMIQTLDGAI